MTPREAAAGLRFCPDTYFEVLFVYTDRALATTTGGICGLRLKIHDGIRKANAILRRSCVPVGIRCVGIRRTSLREWSEEEQLDKEWDTLLDEVESDRIARAQRRHLRADYVCLLVEGASDGGEGKARQWSDPFENFSPRAYIALRAASVDSTMFLHESCHLFGCEHQPDYPGGTKPLYPFSHGHHLRIGDEWHCTLMVRNRAEKPCADFAPFLSNPRLTYRGVALGVRGGADNAGTVTINRRRIAQWGDSVDSPVEGWDRLPGY
jgi:hypothetical protein